MTNVSDERRNGTARRILRRSLVGAILALFMGALWAVPAHAEDATVIPPPTLDAPVRSGAASERVVLAGGCFWGVQAVFQHVNGVSRALSGYAGGTKESADYDTVSAGRTDHAEAVEVVFDP